jgi:divalent metal cation (Fe/Co/Zn/Cd) transporter
MTHAPQTHRTVKISLVVLAVTELIIDPATALQGAHQLAHDAEHTLTHAVPKLTSALVHAYGEYTDHNDDHQVAHA